LKANKHLSKLTRVYFALGTTNYQQVGSSSLGSRFPLITLTRLTLIC